MTATPASSADHNEWLQVLRFVAAGLVLVTHTSFYFHERVDSGSAVWTWGVVGVPIFFVISGIVMVLTTARSPRDASGARDFLIKRFVRIVPLYWLATTAKVAIALAVPSVVNHNHFEASHAVQSYLFIPYFNADGEVRPMHGVGWTLLHEVFFYLLFAAALVARRVPAAWVSASIVALFVAGSVWRLPNAAWVVVTSHENLNFVLGMFAGVALLAQRRGDRRAAFAAPAFAALAAAAVAVGAGVLGEGVRMPIEPVVPALCAATLLLAERPLPRLLHWARDLGSSSYSLYLFHPFLAPAGLMGLKALPAPSSLAGPAKMALVIAGTIAIAHLLHKAVEVPLVRAARRRIVAAGRA